jgi:hypothetical protein
MQDWGATERRVMRTLVIVKCKDGKCKPRAQKGVGHCYYMTWNLGTFMLGRFHSDHGGWLHLTLSSIFVVHMNSIFPSELCCRSLKERNLLRCLGKNKQHSCIMENHVRVDICLLHELAQKLFSVLFTKFSSLSLPHAACPTFLSL